MNSDSGDLIVLVADISMQKAVEGLLSRASILGVIRSVINNAA
jgi:hypothetical protein